jgi:putative hemolysin
MSLANDILERVLQVNTIKTEYQALETCGDPFLFVEKTLVRFDIDYTHTDRDIRPIPPSGPAIVVANHPFGGIDGMILASILSHVRKDFKILANYFLNAIPPMRPLFLPIDPFGNQTSTSRNFASIRAAVRWVRGGGMLVLFPAGEVAHVSWTNRKVQDPPWNPTVARLVQLTQAPVLPFYFHGRNSALFQAGGLVHPLFRTAMLPREMLKKRGTRIRFKIGNLIPYKILSKIQSPADLTEYLRFRTHLLAPALEKDKRVVKYPKKSILRHRMVESIVSAQKPSNLQKEVLSLPAHQKLATNGDLCVYYARANQIPMLLLEIGRLREKTFRRVGEGTGKAMDLDPFDSIYLHLFVWNPNQKEVVGAYRLGPTDEILPRHGKKGLYTQTLFTYQDPLLWDMGPALEMGRTFVRASYQRDYAPLMLLWKGIGQYVVMHPRYKTLFGAVSISNDYQSYSRQLMASFLEVNNYSPDLAKWVKPRNGFRPKRIKTLNREYVGRYGKSLDELSSWISGVEADGKGVPILLKQYLRLGGKVLSFNLDHAFGNALDGLIVVDLTQAEEKVMKRYMGEEGYTIFKAFHANPIPGPSRDGTKALDSFAFARR